MESSTLASLRSAFGDRLQENVLLSGHTAARIGGPADALLLVRSTDELAHTVGKLWELDIPFILLGGGSNILVSDKGVRGVVIINRARKVKFFPQADPPAVEAESGASLNDICRQAERLGLSGFEWAAGIPGSLGGAIYGNAGAYDGNIAGNLVTFELVHQQIGRQVWLVDQMEYDYRTSILKRERRPVIILSARLALTKSTPEAVRQKVEQFSGLRHDSQPHGASLGSMFKNPPGDKAGRLIESAGLKGTRIGNAEISSKHANFFINRGRTRAEDMQALMDLTRKTVFEKFAILLEPEIELVGEW